MSHGCRSASVRRSIQRMAKLPRIFWKRRIAAFIATRRRSAGIPRKPIEAAQGIPSRITWISRHPPQAIAQMCKMKAAALQLRSPRFFVGIVPTPDLIHPDIRSHPIIKLQSLLQSRRSNGETVMDKNELLLRMLAEGFARSAWHGPNLRQSLKGVRAKHAAWRPAHGRHNIWELALHAAYWKF